MIASGNLVLFDTTIHVYAGRISRMRARLECSPLAMLTPATISTFVNTNIAQGTSALRLPKFSYRAGRAPVEGSMTNMVTIDSDEKEGDGTSGGVAPRARDARARDTVVTASTSRTCFPDIGEEPAASTPPDMKGPTMPIDIPAGNTTTDNSTASRAPKSNVGTDVDGIGEDSTQQPEPPPAVVENRFTETLDARISTIGADVDVGSYTLMRANLAGGLLPNPSTVRTEEYVNYFHYKYPQPADEDGPFSITTEVSECPWNKAHRLVRIGVQGRSVDLETAPPNNLVFLIDVSGSMKSDDALPLLKHAFGRLVSRLQPTDRVAIVVYADAARLVLESTPGDRKEKIRSAIDALQAGGSTAGSSGLEMAYDIAEKYYDPSANNRVILATDGDFNVGVVDPAELMRFIDRKRASGIFLTTLGVGVGNEKDATMEMLADHGDGHYTFLDTPKEAERVMVNELAGMLAVIAKDMKLQAEFNPFTVRRYRLIGYENRVLSEREFEDDHKDAGDIGAGHSITALYEVEPATRRRSGREMPRLSDADVRYTRARIDDDPQLASELLSVRLRYKEPHGTESRLVEHPVEGAVLPLAAASADFRFAAAVAEFALLLQRSRYAADASMENVLTLARQGLGADPDGLRAEFVRLVEHAAALLIGSR